VEYGALRIEVTEDVMQKRIAGIGAAVLLWWLANACAFANATEVTVQVDAVFNDLSSETSPGCAVGVIRTGQLIYSRGYGMASIEHGMPITGSTVFYSGSVSKQFTAAAVLMAAREGHLSLDDDVRHWFPELPDYGKTITVRHLIHHTSGLRDYLTLMLIAGVPFETPVRSEWVVGLIARQRALNFDPGSEYLYSNSGYFLLAQLIGRATGQSLREYSEEKFFQPLGMVDTRFHDDRSEVVARRALAYSTVEQGGYQVNWSPSFDQVGSGGLLTTIADLLEWDRSFYDDRLGSGFWDALLEPGTLNDGEVLDYAFGLVVDEYRGHPRIHHGGSMFGYRAYLSRYPSDRVSIALLCNLDTANPSVRQNQLADLLLKGLDPETENGPVEPPSPVAAPEPEAGEQDIGGGVTDVWVGRYRSAELNAIAEFQVEGDRLLLQVGLGEPTEVTVGQNHQLSLPPFVTMQGELADDSIGSFVIDAGRVRGIRFERASD